VGPVLNAWTFTKDDNFQLTGIDFLCLTDKETVTLSEEHSAFEWLPAKDIIDNEKYPQWLREVVIKAEKIYKIVYGNEGWDNCLNAK
jgi:hypothetical protein